VGYTAKGRIRLAIGDLQRSSIIRPTAHAYSIDDRMEELGRSDRYEKELSKITRSKNIPLEWGSPDQRCRAAIKAMAQYGQLIPLNENRKERSVEK
jgi:hypothetical protein